MKIHLRDTVNTQHKWFEIIIKEKLLKQQFATNYNKKKKNHVGTCWLAVILMFM